MRRVLIAAFITLGLTTGAAWADNWPQWRGPAANGISQEKGLPIEWSPEKNIVWKAPLAGFGTSTPIVWGDCVFITSQIGDGPFEQRGRDFENSPQARETGAPAAPAFGASGVEDRAEGQSAVCRRGVSAL